MVHPNDCSIMLALTFNIRLDRTVDWISADMLRSGISIFYGHCSEEHMGQGGGKWNGKIHGLVSHIGFDDWGGELGEHGQMVAICSITEGDDGTPDGGLRKEKCSTGDISSTSAHIKENMR